MYTNISLEHIGKNMKTVWLPKSQNVFMITVYPVGEAWFDTRRVGWARHSVEKKISLSVNAVLEIWFKSN